MVTRKTRVTESTVSPETALARWTDPFSISRQFDRLFEEFRRSFDDLLRPFFPIAPTIAEAPALPTRYAAVDLIDNGDSYIVTAELPGFSKDMVDVQVTKDGVTIRAERKEEKEEKRRNYVHRERAYSSMQRYIAFPEEVIPAKAEGSMKDGVLELRVPKKEPKAAEAPHKVELK
ncbi:MAG: Hsp20/alpha crystallin family protein [Candidatus Bathyarchaeota archaeon]|nr:Hsp20/alpha crystallin family protein [Candidatus Bathyarchaeota archaeon]